MEKKRTIDVRGWVPMMYVTFFGIFQGIAKDHGYALAVHGSCVHDFDLILVPWIENPKPVIEVLTKWSEYVGGIKTDDGLPYQTKCEKPHGRTAYTMQIGGGGYVDVSVIPTDEDRAKALRTTNGMGATPVSPAPTQTPLVDKMED